MKIQAYVVAAAAVALMAGGCSNEPANAGAAAAGKVEQPLKVRVVEARTRYIDRSISVTGSLQPDESVTLGAEVAGRLAKVLVDFGQSVRAGDVVAELDKRDLELQLERVRGALAQALARLGLTPDQADVIPKTTPAIRRAQAQLDNARTKYESAARLVKTGDIAHDRYVELEKAYGAAQAAYDGARHEMATLLATVQSLKAEVKLAEKHVNDATVRAPFSGTVAARMASPGQYLQKNAPIVRLVKPYPLRLRVNVPESAAAAVRVGTDLTFTTDAIPGEEFHAVVREVNPVLDNLSRSLALEARLGRPDRRLKPGMFVAVKLVIQRQVPVTTVPPEAIETIAGLTKVFVIRDGRAVERKILRGREIDGWVEIRRGDVQPGEMVAASSLEQLVDGTPVESAGG